jgi:hypothetical protein
MDLLKGCQKEGFIRIERDRRGGLRVFQGPALQKAGIPVQPLEVVEVVEVEPVEIQPGQVVSPSEPDEIESEPIEPMPIDTTAELLGRAKKRPGLGRGRTRLERPAAAAPRKTAAKKPAAKRTTRAKKQTASDQSES